MLVVVQAVLFVVAPVAAVVASKRFRAVEWLSPVVVCYLVGILLGNVGLVDDTSFAETVVGATVLLAIPLLLFGADLRGWLKVARPTIISFGLAVLAIAIIAPLGVALLPTPAGEGWKVAGMTVGVYTGGTPNLNAIGVAVDANEDTLVLLNAADVIISSFYLLFLMTIAHRVVGRFLPAYVPPGQRDGHGAEEEVQAAAAATDDDHLDPFATTPTVLQVLRSLGAALAVGAAAAGIALAIRGELDSEAASAIVIVAITTLGVAGSFVRPIHDLQGAETVGHFLFLVFAVAIGSQANLAELAGSLDTVFGYLAVVLIAAILLHVVLARLFRIDVDTMLITSTAAVFGPPFVGPVAAVLGNRSLVVSGMTTGVVGLAVGNYAGLAIAYLVRNFEGVRL